MSEAEARPTNFIRQIIDEDLARAGDVWPYVSSARICWQ